MKAGWKPIDQLDEKFKDGRQVLVFLESDMFGGRKHVASFHPNVTMVGGNFVFDAPRITHFQELPEDPAE